MCTDTGTHKNISNIKMAFGFLCFVAVFYKHVKEEWVFCKLLCQC